METPSSVSPITTFGGWAVVILLGFVAYQRYFAAQNARPLVAKPKADLAALATDAKKKAEKAVKPKTKSKPSATASTESTLIPSYDNLEQDDAADKKADREFARQLSTAHSGTKFNAKKSEEKRQKSIKQSKAEEVLGIPTEMPSAPSSHAEDADDDSSRPASPVAAATTSQGVSDMLEPSAPGPSAIRITDTESVKPKERKAKAQAEVVETKKQRQNRKKAEAAKAAREEAEQIRKVQLEQQRRTARIAEGRAAKDGSTFVANQGNAWNHKPTNGDTVQPLDTFEPQQPKPEPVKPAAPAAATNKKQENADPWLSGVPSEEEQMAMLQQEESWSEVKTKKKGKKKETAPEPAAAPAALANGTNGTSAKPSAPATAAKRPIVTSSSSSFAALTPEETDDNDDVEREWDV